jgi:hypothetical protein
MIREKKNNLRKTEKSKKKNLIFGFDFKPNINNNIK